MRLSRKEDYMSKGIIVVDAPGKCDNCPVRHPGLAK